MRTFRIILAAMMVAVLAVSSCKKFELNPDDLDLTLDLDIIKTTYVINFVDTNTGRLIGEDDDARISVAIHGADSQLVVDPSGYRYKEWFSAGGVIVLALDHYAKVPTPEDPVTFLVTASLAGYGTAYHHVTIDTISNREAEIRMVELENPPDGVKIMYKENAGQASGGILVESILLATENGEANLSIPAGTRMVSAAGVPLSGRISVRLESYPTPDTVTLDLLPGGLTGYAVDSAGEEIKHFFTAGYVNVKVTDEHGNQASGIDKKSFDLTIRIDPGLYNEEMSRTVQNGDWIPVYSFDEVTAKWHFEKRSRITVGPEGLCASISLPHLSWYNFSWTGGNTCAKSKKLLFHTNYSWAKHVYYNFRVDAYVEQDGQFIYYAYWNTHASGAAHYFGQPHNNQWIDFSNVPGNKRVKLNFTGFGQNCQESYWYDPSYTGNLCKTSSSDQWETVTLIPRQPTAIFKASITIICTDEKNRRIRLNQPFSFRFRKFGQSCWIQGTYSGEYIRWYITTQYPDIWEIQAFYEGKWQPEKPYQYKVNEIIRADQEYEMNIEVPTKCK